MRLGIRSVSRRRIGKHAITGTAGAVGSFLHTHWHECGRPRTSKVTQVHPVSSSTRIARQ